MYFQKEKIHSISTYENTDTYFSMCINTQMCISPCLLSCCKQDNRHKMESLMLSVTKGDLTTVLAPSEMES